MLTSYFKKYLCIYVLTACYSAQAWNPFGPNNYDDCIIQNMKGVTSDTAAAAIRYSCYQKFPDKKSKDNSQQNLRAGTPRINVWDKPYNAQIFTNITTSRPKFNSYGSMEISVTNKNQFNVSGIYIGVTSDKKPGKCSMEKNDYIEILECNGDINSNTTKTLFCPSPQGSWCVVGFKGEFQLDVDKFFKEIQY